MATVENEAIKTIANAIIKAAQSVSEDNAKRQVNSFANFLVNAPANAQTGSELATRVLETLGHVASVTIDNAVIDTAQIKDLETQVARIVDATIDYAEIEQAVIDNLDVNTLKALFAKIQVGDIDFATFQKMAGDALVIERAVANSVYIKNLVATEAMFASATMNDLVVKGTDNKYYRIVVQADGIIGSEEVHPTAEEIADGEMSDGRGIVFDANVDVEDIVGKNIVGNTGVFGDILTRALSAGKITASQALITSAIVKELYVNAINAIGETLTLNARQIIMNVSDNYDTFTLDDWKVGGVNYIRDSESHRTPDELYPNVYYWELTSNLSPDEVYTLSMESAVQISGATQDGMTFKLVKIKGDNTTEDYMHDTLPFSTIRTEYTFKTEDEDGDAVAFRAILYPGIAIDEHGDPIDLTGVKTEYSRVKLEMGTVATGWTESPEDAKARVDGIDQEIDGIESDVGSVRDRVGQVENDLQTQIAINQENVAFINGYNTNTKGFIDNISSYFRFVFDSTNPYMEIGANESDIKVRLYNNKLSFYNGDNEIAYFSNQKLYVADANAFNTFIMGEKDDTNGNLMIVSTNSGAGLIWTK